MRMQNVHHVGTCHFMRYFAFQVFLQVPSSREKLSSRLVRHDEGIVISVLIDPLPFGRRTSIFMSVVGLDGIEQN